MLEGGHPGCKRSWMGHPWLSQYISSTFWFNGPPLSWQPLYGTNHMQHWNIIVVGVLLIDWKIALCFTVNAFPTTFCTCSRFGFTHKDDNTWCNSQKVPAGGRQGAIWTNVGVSLCSAQILISITLKYIYIYIYKSRLGKSGTCIHRSLYYLVFFRGFTSGDASGARLHWSQKK